MAVTDAIAVPRGPSGRLRRMRFNCLGGRVAGYLLLGAGPGLCVQLRQGQFAEFALPCSRGRVALRISERSVRTWPALCVGAFGPPHLREVWLAPPTLFVVVLGILHAGAPPPASRELLPRGVAMRTDDISA